MRSRSRGLERDQVEVSESVEDLRQVRQAIAREAGALTALASKHQTALAAAGLTFDQFVILTVDYAPLDAVVTKR